MRGHLYLITRPQKCLSLVLACNSMSFQSSRISMSTPFGKENTSWGLEETASMFVGMNGLLLNLTISSNLCISSKHLSNSAITWSRWTQGCSGWTYLTLFESLSRFGKCVSFPIFRWEIHRLSLASNVLIMCVTSLSFPCNSVSSSFILAVRSVRNPGSCSHRSSASSLWCSLHESRNMRISGNRSIKRCSTFRNPTSALQHAEANHHELSQPLPTVAWINGAAALSLVLN